MRRSASVLSSYSLEDSEMETEENPNKRASTSNLDSEPRSSSKRVKGTPTKSNLSEKDQRKAARMIRNRQAAQASRDRKKEHTQLLEQRISELEAQLDGDSSVLRAPSVDSVGSASAPLITALEEENQALRNSLSLEKSETTRLRTRLENLESKFGRLESLFSASSLPPLPVAPPVLSPSLSLSALPLDDLPEESTYPSLFEPIFSFSPADALQLSQGGSPASIILDEMELGRSEIHGEGEEEKELKSLATPICSALVAAEANQVNDFLNSLSTNPHHPTTDPSSDSLFHSDTDLLQLHQSLLPPLPLVDHSFGGETSTCPPLELDELILANAWTDWANEITDVDAGIQQESTEHQFGMFDFLSDQQEISVGH